MYDLRDLVTVGVSGTVTRVVQESDTATNYSPQLQTLLATPTCIGLGIQASVAAIDALLPDGFVSIGRHIDFEHTASTFMGVEVRMTAKVVDVQPTYVDIVMTLSDEMGEIGHGTHRRSIVNVASLMARAMKRKELMMNKRPI